MTTTVSARISGSLQAERAPTSLTAPTCAPAAGLRCRCLPRRQPCFASGSRGTRLAHRSGRDQHTKFASRSRIDRPTAPPAGPAPRSLSVRAGISGEGGGSASARPAGRASSGRGRSWAPGACASGSLWGWWADLLVDGGPQDDDLAGGVGQQPGDVVGGEAGVAVGRGRDHDPVKPFVVDHLPERVTV